MVALRSGSGVIISSEFLLMQLTKVDWKIGPMTESFIAKTWTNGNPSRSGSGYGLKITRQDRDRFFKRSWTHVTLRLPFRCGPCIVDVNCSKKSFWNNCRELIRKDIGLWFIENNIDSWPRGNPHSVRMTCVAEREFEVSLCRPSE